MARRLRNPLAQGLGLVLRGMRDRMGPVSSSEVAGRLGLAASHYRMIEAGSAILQPARAMRVVQTFEGLEFIPLCQVLVCIQILDSLKRSVADMRTTAKLLSERNPQMSGVFGKLAALWPTVEKAGPGEVARAIGTDGLRDELERFLTTEPVTFTGSEIDSFMSPTYKRPLSGRLYGKIGNILQGVAPFYLDTVLQLIDNLRNVTPRVTADELARWERLHRNRFSHIIGVVRDPEIILDVSTFDYNYLWDESFEKIVIIYRDGPTDRAGAVHGRIAELLKTRFERERLRYERELACFDEVMNAKFRIEPAPGGADEIDRILQYRAVAMNNLWIYIMSSGYVVPFIDNATVDSGAKWLYGTSLGYDETGEKLIKIRKLFSDIGLSL